MARTGLYYKHRGNVEKKDIKSIIKCPYFVYSWNLGRCIFYGIEFLLLSVYVCDLFGHQKQTLIVYVFIRHLVLGGNFVKHLLIASTNGDHLSSRKH